MVDRQPDRELSSLQLMLLKTTNYFSTARKFIFLVTQCIHICFLPAFYDKYDDFSIMNQSVNNLCLRDTDDRMRNSIHFTQVYNNKD